MAITNASTLAEYASGISTQGATLTVDANNKRVGIGTTNPQAMLQVGTGVTVFGNAGIASFTSLKLSGETDSTSTSTGTLTVTGGVGIGLSLTVGGDVSVGGTITYEDVTNVDAIGIITARSGLRVVGGGVTCVGVATFFNNIDANGSLDVAGDVSIADKIVHTGDTNTLIRFPAAGTIRFDTDGNERLRITSAGKVGIGTTNPLRALHVEAADCRIRLTDIGVATDVELQNDSGSAVLTTNGATNIRLQTNNTERLRINSSGQISIRGTTTAFDATGDLDSLQLYYETDSGQASIGPYSSGGSTHLSFYTNAGAAAATEKLRITSGGDIGVNCDSPTSITNSRGITLQASGGTAAGFINFMDSADNSDARVLADDGSLYIHADASDNTADSVITFNVDTNEKARITSAGLVGINTSVPTAQLSFLAKRSTQTYPPICFQANAGAGLADAAISTTDDSGGVDIMMGSNVYMGQNGAFVRYMSSYGSAAVRCQYTGNTLFYNKSGNNAPVESMRINGDGEVGIGTNNPTKILDVLAKDGVTQTYIEKQTSTNNASVVALTLSSRSSGAAAANFGPAIGFQHAFGGSNYAGCQIASECGSDTNTASIVMYPRNYGYTPALRINHDGKVGIASAIPAYQLDVKHTSERVASFQSTKTTDEGVEMRLYHNSASPADGDQLGYIQFTGNDDALNPTIYNAIIGYSKDVTNGTEDGELRFYSRKASVFTQQMTLYGDDGSAKIHNGNLVFGTAGTGIDFSATASTGTSELFADYEEGTWTPVVDAEGTSPTTSGGFVGHYTKIGKEVKAYFACTNVTSSGGSGQFRISGLPFTTNQPLSDWAANPFGWYNHDFPNDMDGTPILYVGDNHTFASGLYFRDDSTWIGFQIDNSSSLYYKGMITYTAD